MIRKSRVMRRLADISSFELLQNQAHRSMGVVSEMAVFNGSNAAMYTLVKTIGDKIRQKYPDAGRTELKNLLKSASTAIHFHIKNSPEFADVDTAKFNAEFMGACEEYIKECFPGRGRK